MKMRASAILAPLVLAAGSVTAAAPTWTPYTAASDGFTISFPGRPAMHSAPSAQTLDGVYRTYEKDVGDAAYVASVYHFKPGTTPEASTKNYAALLKAYAAGAKCALKPSHAVTIAGVLALEATCIDRPGKTDHLMDVLISGDFLYLIVAAGNPGFAKSAAATRFRSTFALLPVPSAAPPATTAPAPTLAPAASPSPSP